MLDRLRHSLALRLALQYAFVFALGAAMLFGVLYWLLANALDSRERAALTRQTEELSAAFERGDILYDVSRLLLELGPTKRDLSLLERLRSQDRDISQE